MFSAPTAIAARPRPVDAHDCRGGLRRHPLSAQYVARIRRSTTPRADAFEPGGAVTPAAAKEAGIGRLILHKELRQREGSQDRSGRILRAIGLGGQILSDLGIQRIRLLSNTPMHIPALEGFGLEIVEQVHIPVEECTRVG